MNAFLFSTVTPSAFALDDERGDAAPVPLAARHLGHDDEQVADHSVGRPELDSVEHVLGAVFATGLPWCSAAPGRNPRQAL